MRRTISNVLRLIGKELHSIWADPVMLILVVYSFTVAIYMVSNDASTDVRHVAIAVVDEDQSQLSRRLAAAAYSAGVETFAPAISSMMAS